eukprot:gene6391-7123_t
MDRGELTCAIFLDLRKAFDTVGHSTIINKFPKFGINGLAKDWLSSYLFGRHQRVPYNGKLSSLSPIYCGVPQGSILGPFPFLLTFNDSTESITTCQMVMYAE